jgi:hypothetical protein
MLNAVSVVLEKCILSGFGVGGCRPGRLSGLVVLVGWGCGRLEELALVALLNSLGMLTMVLCGVIRPSPYQES